MCIFHMFSGKINGDKDRDIGDGPCERCEEPRAWIVNISQYPPCLTATQLMIQ